MTDLVIVGIGIVGIGAMLIIAEGDLAGLFPLVAARGRDGAISIGRTVSFWFHTRKRLAIVDGKLAIATTGGPSSDPTNAGRNSWKWTLSSGGHKVSFMAPFGVTDDLREQIAAWAVRRGVTVDLTDA